MLVAIGASSGGLEAMIAILQHLPAGYCLPTVLVLHQRANRESGVPQMLARYTHLSVCEPDDKQRIERGYLYVAPPNYHLLVEREKIFSLNLDAPVNFSRPSIDLLLESAAFAYGPQLVACVLSGANSDGTAGAVAVKKRHGRVYVQAPETAGMSVMPLSVTRQVTVDGMLSPAMLAEQLMALQAERASA
jgi:two-component system chemotaxis response regulator CheB